MKKHLKKVSVSAYLAVPIALLMCALVFLSKFRVNAQSNGETLGTGIGQLAGRAIGSLEGLTVGWSDGNKKGKEAGLSAKDTTAELSGKIQEVQKLQVLVASGTFSDIISIGDDYAALLAMDYNAMFTVDLSTAEIKLKADGLHILLDQPKVEFIPFGEIVKKNEYQKHPYVGSAEYGYVALLNSANQMKLKATEKLESDTAMMAAAKASAETQLIQLVNAVSLSKPKVFLAFRG